MTFNLFNKNSKNSEPLIGFYIDEIIRQGKFKFLGIFPPPNSIYIILFTFILFLALEISGQYYFIPSIIAFYIIFEVIVYGGYIVEMAEECLVDELYMESDLQTNEVLKNEFPNDPLYVIDEDRVEIVRKIIEETKHPNFFQKIIKYWQTFLIILGVYFILGLIIYSVNY
jgi:hypothetical protein